MIQEYSVTGHKGGGGKPHTPQETPDSLHSLAKVRMLIALGEGEFENIPTANELRQRVYLGGTPVQNADGSENFPNTRVEFRPGTQSQSVIPGFSAVESEIPVGVKVEKNQPWVRQISNLGLDAVRIRIGIPALYTQEDDGDLVGGRIDYQIVVYTDNASPKTFNFSAVGKTMSLYERDHRIELPEGAASSWRVEVRRVTNDSTDARVVNAFQVQSITEIIDARLRYPLTALLFVEFDAKAFQNIPLVSIRAKGRKVLVPTNYNPVTHTYSGNWDGTFKRAWTDNPAWHWYDICITERLGLGRRIKPEMLNRYAIYQIAQRCDQLIPDGNGGQEIRFKNDMYIQAQTDAWTVLKDLAAIFAGMSWWGNQMLNLISDQPVTSAAHVLNNANVIDGRFDYATGSQKTRYSTFAVAYGDPTNHYADAIANGMRSELVRRYKINQLSISAIGCTRQSEAQRRGHWALITNQLDSQVSFQVGLEGLFYIPGSVVAIADVNISGGAEIRGGRLTDPPGNRNVVITDQEITFRHGDRFIVRTAGGQMETRDIVSVSGTSVTLDSALSADPIPNQPFVVDGDDIQVQQYRITDLQYDDANNTFTVRGVEYNESKYDAVDKGSRLDTGIYTQVPDSTLKGPASVTLKPTQVSSQGVLITNVDIVFPPVPNAMVYEIQWRRTSLQDTSVSWGNDWVNLPRTASNGARVENVFEGNYQARVRAIGMGETSSPWVSSAITSVSGRIGALKAPIMLTAESGLHQIKWRWDLNNAASDISYTELQVQVPGQSTWTFVTNAPYPADDYAQTSLEFGIYLNARARVADKMGNLSGWSNVVQGQVSDNVNDYMKGLDESFLSAEDGKVLLEKINTTPEGIYESMLGDHQSILSERAEFGNIYADIQVNYNLIADQTQALSQLETLVSAHYRDQQSAVYTLQTANATQDQAFAAYQTSVAARFGTVEGKVDNNGNAIAQNEAAIATNQQAIATQTQALADYKVQVAAEFGQQSAAIEQKMTSQFTATSGSAIYSLKAGVTYNGTYYDAGMVLSTIANGSGVISRIAFKADQFYIMHPSNGTLVSAFIVSGGAVYIDTARINNASISFAQISDTLRSNNFVSGSTGWNLPKSGNAEFNNVVVRGAVYANTGSFTGTINATSGSFTGTVNATSGKFTGSVEATTFVGDVANTYVAADLQMGGPAVATRTINFTDSTTTARAKTVSVDAVCEVRGSNNSGWIDINITIAGNTRRYRVSGADAGTTGVVYIPVKHTRTGITAASVAVSIQTSNNGMTGAAVYSPTVTVTRGTGAWSSS